MRLATLVGLLIVLCDLPIQVNVDTVLDRPSILLSLLENLGRFGCDCDFER